MVSYYFPHCPQLSFVREREPEIESTYQYASIASPIDSYLTPKITSRIPLDTRFEFSEGFCATFIFHDT